jgi:hypothetical protein
MIRELFILTPIYFLYNRRNQNLDAESKFFCWSKPNYMEPPGCRGIDDCSTMVAGKTK